MKQVSAWPCEHRVRRSFIMSRRMKMKVMMMLTTDNDSNKSDLDQLVFVVVGDDWDAKMSVLPEQWRPLELGAHAVTLKTISPLFKIY